MTEIWKKCDFINNFVLKADPPPSEADCPRAFYIHSSIRGKCIKVMKTFLKANEWEMYDRILEIGTKCYNMRLIIISQATQDQINFVEDSITKSQFSFPWEETPTLFVDLLNDDLIERFIRKHDLKAFVLKTEIKLGITATDELIKVVSFKKSVNEKFDLINEYVKYLKSVEQFHKRKYYFMTFALPWENSLCLQNTHISEQFYSVFPIILRHLGTFYTSDLSIMDLISLELALSDVRHPIQSENVNYEIGFMIKRELANIVDQNDHLDIEEYLIDKNSKPLENLIEYLVYNFQLSFETVHIGNILAPDNIGKTFKLNDAILLEEEVNAIKILKEKCNVEYSIHGIGYDKMNLSLFIDLIECQNVSDIFLDTNYRWVKDGSKINRCISSASLSIDQSNKICVYLEGGNTYKFIEEFVTELKTITMATNRISLDIDCKLNDYSIFDNLTDLEINLTNIEIDTNMLENLQSCQIKPTLNLDCSFESTCRNWELLNNLQKIKFVSFREDERTWIPLFDLVWNEMRKSNTNEFKLNSDAKYICINTPYKSIYLDEIKFTVDEQNWKLEIRNKDNKLIDLYYEMPNFEPTEKSDYEFYE